MRQYCLTVRPAMITAVCALLLAACGGGGKSDPSEPQRPAAGTSPDEVIRAWSADMRASDVDAAAALFAVPSRVANLSPVTTLRSRRDVVAFNQSLPCGSRLVRTVAHHGLTIATFVLTRRPGADCGTGTGERAYAAFEIRRGKIVR